MSELSLPALRPMTVQDLGLVLSWRNHPEVRRYMYMQHEISLEEHANWFTRASQDPQKHLLVFEVDDRPLGFVKIQLIASGGIADWGFYLAPDAPRGTGRKLGSSTLRYVFEFAKLHKLCGQVLAFNERSIQFHLSLGFEREGILRHQHFNGQQYQDVVCFGLLASEWYQAN